MFESSSIRAQCTDLQTPRASQHMPCQKNPDVACWRLQRA